MNITEFWKIYKQKLTTDFTLENLNDALLGLQDVYFYCRDLAIKYIVNVIREKEVPDEYSEEITNIIRDYFDRVDEVSDYFQRQLSVSILFDVVKDDKEMINELFSTLSFLLKVAYTS